MHISDNSARAFETVMDLAYKSNLQLLMYLSISV